MAKAKKAAKKQARKATKKKAPAKKKTIAKRKPAATPRRKNPAKKSAVKKSARKSAADGVRLGVSLDLDTRLRTLATKMGKSLEDVLIQALTEFADNWEDHLRTLTVLHQGDDRMQLAVPQEEEEEGAR